MVSQSWKEQLNNHFVIKAYKDARATGAYAYADAIKDANPGIAWGRVIFDELRDHVSARENVALDDNTETKESQSI